jgi:putative ABC transport system permease protein
VIAAIKVGLRQFRRRPTVAFVTILVLGLGTAAAATVFTIVDTVVLRPLPYERPDRLVTIWDANTSQALAKDPISPVNFMDQRGLPVFTDAAAWWRPGVNLVDPGLDPVRVSTIEVSGNIFQVLGVQPQIGSGFPQGGPLFVPNEGVAVISDRLWRARYSGDPSIVGKQLIFNGIPHLIVGVMPPKFNYPDDVDVWQRLTWDMTQHSRAAHFMEAVARLSDWTTIEQAQSAVDSLWTRIERDFGSSQNSPGQGWSSRLIPQLDEQLGYYRPALLVLFGAVGLLLLIGVLNVASLQLARSLEREREMAIRSAMGASPRRIIMQLASESFVLSLAGASVGVAAAAAALPLVVAFTPVQIPRLEDAAVSWPALGVGLAVAMISTVVLGVLPALFLMRSQMTTTIKSGERGSSRGAGRIYSAVVVSEVALACALLISSALLVRTVGRMMSTPVGVEADDTVITTIQLTRQSASQGSPIDRWRMIADIHGQIVQMVSDQPGVEAVGMTNMLPLEIGWRIGFMLHGQAMPANANDMPQAQLHSVSDGYFEAMGARMVAGRSFTKFDTNRSSPVVIVNESFARRHLTDRAAVGQTLAIPLNGIGPLSRNLMTESRRSGFEVVGVVRDIKNVPLGQNVEPAMYIPMHQHPFSDVFVAIKARTQAEGVAAFRTALKMVAPEVPVSTPRTWGDRFGDRTAEPRLLMAVLIFFGGLAALLAALGVYGLFSWSVSLRVRELAIRLALGARPASVGGLILRQSAILVAVGLVSGFAVVRFAEGLLRAVLYEVSPSDMQSTLVAGGLLLLAATIACLPPAIRAMRVDPVEGLRTE